jgi:intracellular sulfur oxidation DsrE/DsrF family protein
MTEKYWRAIHFIGVALLSVGLCRPAAWAADATPPAAPHRLFHITLHTPAEIEGMLTRAEQLSKTRRPDATHPAIALVLHGPEIEFFARRNYSKYRRLVDLAAKLDAAGVVEVKMCQTEMRARELPPNEVPGFIELVPYGPDEEQRLLRKGYVYL